MLSRLISRTRELRHSDAGVTLAELVVAMGLATLIGALTLVVFTSTSSAVDATGDSLNGSGAARVTLQTWQSLLSTADAPQTTSTCPTGSTSHRFEWLTSTETLFYSDVNNRAADGTCTPNTMVWLALRNGALLEVRYAFSSGAYQRSVCRALSMSPQATVTAGTLFTPNPGQVLTSVDYGAAFAASSPFTAVTGCSTAPTTVSSAAVTDTDTTANNALAQIGAVGVDFTVTDSTGTHPQSYDGVVTILGGSS
jgi:hypothetical protein